MRLQPLLLAGVAAAAAVPLAPGSLDSLASLGALLNSSMAAGPARPGHDAAIGSAARDFTDQMRMQYSTVLAGLSPVHLEPAPGADAPGADVALTVGSGGPLSHVLGDSEARRAIAESFDRLDARRDVLVIEQMRDAALEAHGAMQVLATFRDASWVPVFREAQAAWRFLTVETALERARGRVGDVAAQAARGGAWDAGTSGQIAGAVRLLDEHMLGPLSMAFDVKGFLTPEQVDYLKQDFEALYLREMVGMYRGLGEVSEPVASWRGMSVADLGSWGRSWRRRGWRRRRWHR